MKYAYQNKGQMRQTGGGDKRALGSLGGASTLEQPTLLPTPGSPEIMAMGDCGCGCKGAGTCGMGDGPSSPTTLVVLGIAGYFLYKHFKKRR